MSLTEIMCKSAVRNVNPLLIRPSVCEVPLPLVERVRPTSRRYPLFPTLPCRRQSARTDGVVLVHKAAANLPLATGRLNNAPCH